ncbi:MAG: lasso peptide biosynthesis B2 protein [Hapalosiphonaceae cyanobacterium JJU2]|nr:MAG: lasso peptide biosynthesis B2 protein [Hapalosiphonaceae cyanobacterium JJU2]
MRLLFKFLRFEAGDRHLLIMTLILLAAMRLGLWLLPFRTLLKLLPRISGSQVTQQVSVDKISWAVKTVSRYIPGVKCLARALTTQVLMNRNGHSCELRIGVAKGEKGILEAHAWIEHEGLIVMGYLADLSRFMPLPSLEGLKL